MIRPAPKTRHVPWYLSLALLLLLLLAPAPAVCDEGAPEGEAEEADAGEVVLREATREEARELLAALKKVARKKNATEVMPGLEPLEEVTHESFDKTLIKLLRHPSSLVAMKVADMWKGRVTPKNRKKVWAAAWTDKANAKRFGVKAKVLLALATGDYLLNDKQYKEIERTWRWMVGNPQISYADALIDICTYFERTKDKRHCRWMAEELDEPYPTNVNSGSNPPQEWWERRWKMWKPMKPAAVSALKAITGQEFDKVETARRWFEENERSFGFKW